MHILNRGRRCFSAARGVRLHTELRGRSACDADRRRRWAGQTTVGPYEDRLQREMRDISDTDVHVASSAI